MNLKLTEAQVVQILKRVVATYVVAFSTAILASQFGWSVSSLEKAGVAGLFPVLALLQSIASSYLSGTPALIASVRLFVTGHSAPSIGAKYGKLPRKNDGRTLWFHEYITGLPTPPKVLTWAQKLVNLGMMLNDRLGDCTIAAVGHSVQVWTANALAQFTIPDTAILAAYSAISGYTPGQPSTDTGCVELDVLNYWRKTGVGGHKIGAFVAVDRTDLERIKQAIDLFGLVYVGTNVPAGWEQAPAVWDVLHGAAGKIVGGHAIIYVGYDATGFQIVSWGQLFTLTYRAHAKYVDETYGIVSADWIANNGLAPSGFNIAQLTADLPAVG